MVVNVELESVPCMFGFCGWQTDCFGVENDWVCSDTTIEISFDNTNEDPDDGCFFVDIDFEQDTIETFTDESSCRYDIGNTSTSNVDALSIKDQVIEMMNGEEWNVFMYLLIIILSLFFVVFLVSSFHAKKPFELLCISPIDDASSIKIIITMFQLWDIYSDTSVCYTYWQIYYQFSQYSDLYFIVALISTICIIFPLILNLIYSIVFLPQKLNGRSKAWMVGNRSVNTRWFLFLTLITGNTYCALLLCNSKILGMSLFDMGLSKSELKSLQNVSYVTILFEVWFFLLALFFFVKVS